MATTEINGPKPEPAFEGEQSLTAQDGRIYVSLTYDPLDATQAMARVKSPKAGAVVLFAGTFSIIPHFSRRETDGPRSEISS
jgi:hypothetical protein